MQVAAHFDDMLQIMPRYCLMQNTVASLRDFVRELVYRMEGFITAVKKPSKSTESNRFRNRASEIYLPITDNKPSNWACGYLDG